MDQQQQEIKNWFNQTYTKWGFYYLRPLEAYYLFHTILSPKPQTKHLDVACGLGHVLRTMLDRNIQAYGFDISDVAVERAKTYCPEAEISVQNAESIPYGDRFFNTISCIGSLERMLNRGKVLDEIHRVLADDGQFCLMVRNSKYLTWKIRNLLGLVNEKGHQDANSYESWASLLKQHGFKITAVYPDHWPFFRFKKTFIPFIKHDTSKLIRFPFSIKYAYEFIFLLEKDDEPKG